MRRIMIAAVSVGCLCLAATGVVATSDGLEAETPPPAAGTPAVFPVDWFFMPDKPDRQLLLRRTDGKAAPELKVGTWLKDEPTTMEALRGKIVVLDFWGTWCAPCLKALPHTNEMAEEYKDRGVEFIAICDATTRPERAPGLVEKLGLNFRVVMDQGKATYNAYLGQWYPFYVLVDRKGIIRASGLRPETLQAAVDVLLTEQPEEPATESVSTRAPVPKGPRSEWLEGTAAQRAALAAIEGAPAAELQIVESSWQNANPMDVAALKGKVVLLDFWGTWCGPCLQTVPHINAMHKKYAPDGLVVIGVCHSRNADTMPAVAAKHGIAYPIAADTAGATFKAYHVNGTPDYFLIDRQGNIRFADVANDHVEDAIRFLLAEPAPGATN